MILVCEKLGVNFNHKIFLFGVSTSARLKEIFRVRLKERKENCHTWGAYIRPCTNPFGGKYESSRVKETKKKYWILGLRKDQHYHKDPIFITPHMHLYIYCPHMVCWKLKRGKYHETKNWYKLDGMW